MVQMEIKGAKELSNMLLRASKETSKEMPVLLHQQAQRLVYDLYRVFHSERPLPQEISAAALSSLDSGRGLRVNKRNRIRAEAFLEKHRAKVDEKIRRTQAAKRQRAREQERIRKLKAQRNIVMIRHKGHNRQLVSYSPLSKRAISRLKIKNPSNRDKSTWNFLNVSALAARYEINRRRSGSGSMGVSFLNLYKKLREKPLGTTVSFSSTSTNKYTWNNKVIATPEIVHFYLNNKGFRTERPENFERVERVFRQRVADLEQYLTKKAKQILK